MPDTVPQRPDRDMPRRLTPEEPRSRQPRNQPWPCRPLQLRLRRPRRRLHGLRPSNSLLPEEALRGSPRQRGGRRQAQQPARACHLLPQSLQAARCHHRCRGQGPRQPRRPH